MATAGHSQTGTSPMVTSMKSTPGSVPFKHSVSRLYIASLGYLNTLIEITRGRTPKWGGDSYNLVTSAT